MASGDYRFIMTYQDNLTKFFILRPPKCKTAVAVAQEQFTVLDSFVVLT